MVAVLAALALAPWTHPLEFRRIHGWRTGASGNVRSLYVGGTNRKAEPLESAAWIARGVRYRDRATADPPNTTLRQLPKGGVIVWAVIYSPVFHEPTIRLDLTRAKRHACCEAVGVPAELELTGAGPRDAFSVIVRIYFGSPPSGRLQVEAQRALDALMLPAGR